MKDIFSDWFATIYERLFSIFNADYQDPVFQYLFDSGFYIMLGVIFIFVPLALMALFYYVWHYPYSRWWHWLIWFAITILIVFGCTFGYANTFILGSNAPEMVPCFNVQVCSDYINGLPLEYAKANIILGMILGFIGSLILKQWSKVQTHIPF